VRIDRDSSGRLIIASEDATALQLMRKLVGEMHLPQADFKVFRMKHRDSAIYAVAEKLKQYFDEKQKWDRPATRFYDPNSGKSISASRETDGRKSTKQRQPKFIVDSDSNSILAVGADAEQLKVIGELLELYDADESREPKPARITRLVEIRHSTARQIGEAIKDVYRDLLSVETPIPRNGDPQIRRPPEQTYTYAYSSAGGRNDVPDTLVKFKGQLSIGVDESSNTLVLSAPEALLENVVVTIESLDQISRSTAPHIRVVKINRDINAGEFQKRLQRAVAKSQPQQPQANQSQPQQK
jgi:type II secretory pathway component GspD/PulD (secretin)